jgi:predicted RNase H-like nuclease (RuvC/YqgF family)
MTEKLSENQQLGIKELFDKIEALTAENTILKEQKDASYNALKQVIVNQGEELESFYELFDNQSRWYDYIYDKLQNCNAEVKRLTDLNSGLSELTQGMDYCAEEAEKEVTTLKEQNAENERWAARHKATKEEWGKQLTKSEAEVKRLQGRLENECNKSDELQAWIERFAGLCGEDSGEVPEVILEAVAEKVDRLATLEAEVKTLKETQGILNTIVEYGVCKVDNAVNGGLCVGKHCYHAWITCEERKIISLSKYVVDIDLKERLK